jgi:hypothetical protein
MGEKTTPTVEALIGAVAARHGILLKPDEPAFALVTINELLLERSARELAEHLDRRLKDFEESIRRVEVRAGRLLAQEVKAAAAEVRTELQRDIDAARVNAAELVHRVEAAHRHWALIRWGVIGLVFGAALFASGVWLGHYCL